MLPLIVFIFVAIQLLCVAYIDIKTRKISNFWVLVNSLFFILLTFIYPEVYIWSAKMAIYPIVFIVVGFILFCLNVMGGGDSKYLASLYLLIPLEVQDETFSYLLYATVLVGGSLLVYNLVKNLDIIINQLRMGDIVGIKKIFGKKFTFAPVIFIAWMWFGWQNLKDLTY